MSETPAKVNPGALTIEQLANILSNVGRQLIEPAWIEADLLSGAPCNADGTINLVHYTIWLVREMSHRET